MISPIHSDKQDMGAIPCSREPNPQAVSALTGFDPGRKFTPGPWETRRAKSPDNTGGFDYAIAAGGKIIAEAFENVGFADGRSGYDSRPASANANLIAAAPELYEALAGAVHFADAVAYRDDTLSRALREWLSAGASALARARGEQS